MHSPSVHARFAEVSIGNGFLNNSISFVWVFNVMTARVAYAKMVKNGYVYTGFNV